MTPKIVHIRRAVGRIFLRFCFPARTVTRKTSKARRKFTAIRMSKIIGETKVIPANININTAIPAHMEAVFPTFLFVSWFSVFMAIIYHI
jgi:hypothetical protein